MSDLPPDPPGAHPRLRVAAVIALAGLCGWLVMELEILGTRILVPYFGSAIDVVMGSVIGVFLLSLSVGYLYGGRISKSQHFRRILALNLAVAGIWLCLLPRFNDAVCDRLLDLDLDDKWGSLLAALILFAVPTALLGTASPTAVRWLTRQAQDAGLTSGLVLSFSTLASFAGTIVTAFYLVRHDMNVTIRVSGALLLAAAVALLIASALPPRP